MTNQQDTALLPVEQDDREAAAELHIADCGEPLSPYDRRIEQDYRSGKNDDWNDVQAFARHRIAAEQTKPSASCEAGEVERVIEAIKPIQTWDGDRLDMNLTREEMHAIATAAITALRANAPEAQGEVERVAQWLHDEGGFDEAWSTYTWPEHRDDTGQRDGGFVRIVPSDVQAKFRDVARRLLRGRTLAALSERGAVGEEVEALKSKLRNVISHATGGACSDHADLSLNEIAVQISRHHNRVWESAQEATEAKLLALADEWEEEERDGRRAVGDYPGSGAIRDALSSIQGSGRKFLRLG